MSTPIENNTAALQDILDAVNNLPDAGSGGVDTSDATATAGDILSGKTAYVNDTKITGTIATKTASNLTASGATVTVPAGYYASQATKSVSTATQATPSISVSSAGKITATHTQSAGYVSAGTKTATKQLTTQAAQTITPGTSNKTISSGRYLTGTQTIKGDSNLVAANIKSGVSIFGVTGTHAGGEDLDSEMTTQADLISQLSTILDSKAAGGDSGGAITFGELSVTNYGMYEPGLNEYEAVSEDLHASTRRCILLYRLSPSLNVSGIGTYIVSFIRNDTSETFRMINDYYALVSSTLTTIQEDNTITLYCNGNLIPSGTSSIQFIAF